MMNELYHEGILGMHWGKRNGPPYPLRAQQLSSEEKRLSKRQIKKEIKRSKKEEYYKSMTDEELQSHIDRLKMENEYRSLSGLQVNTGQKSAMSYIKEGGKEGIKDLTKKTITTIGGNYLNSLSADSARRDKQRDREAEEDFKRKVESKKFNASKEISKYNSAELSKRVKDGKYTDDEVKKLNDAYKSLNEFGKHNTGGWNYSSGVNNKESNYNLSDEEKAFIDELRKRKED